MFHWRIDVIHAGGGVFLYFNTPTMQRPSYPQVMKIIESQFSEPCQLNGLTYHISPVNSVPIDVFQ